MKYLREESFLGCFCAYSDQSSMDYVKESLEKTLLTNLEQGDRLPFQGLPIVVLYGCHSGTAEKDLLKLQEEGQNLAQRYSHFK